MADPHSTSPPPEDRHWGISYLREDLQDVKQDLRDLRREFADLRKEVAQQLRHNLTVTLGIVGVFATVVIAFIQYKLPG
jgi:hypothetical protein